MDSATNLKSCLKQPAAAKNGLAAKVRNIDGKLRMDTRCVNFTQPLSDKDDDKVHNGVKDNTLTSLDVWEDHGDEEFPSQGQSLNKAKFRQFFNDETVVDSDCVLPLANLQAIKHKFENTLMSYFVGKSFAFPLVKNYVTNTWSKFSFQKVIRDEDDFFFFKFNSITGVEQVLEQGPWMIRNTSVILNKWSPNLSLCKDKGCIGFARALIKVSATTELKKEVIMAVPHEDGTGHTKVQIIVEFEWKPPLCMDCHVNFEETIIAETPNPKGAALPLMRILMFSVAAWNIKGLNRALKQLEVRQVVNENQLSVCAILESHVDLSLLSNVWNNTSKRRQLWTDLGLHKYVVRGHPWILMGDFKVALNMEDSFSGSSRLNAAMYDFKACVNNIEVMDINASGLHYTWKQNPRGGRGLPKKLDRIMGNLEFVDTFPGAYGVFQPYRISDHSPTVLKIPSLTSLKPKPFKFFNFFMFKSEFLVVVKEQWNTNVKGHNMYQVVTKMKNLKKLFRKLLHSHGNLHDRVNALRTELDEVQKALDKNHNDLNLHEEEAIYVQAFTDSKINEERFLKQKAKIEWLEVGDSNSTFFHKSVKSRNRSSHIKVIRGADNVEVTGPHVADTFVDHYQQFLGTSMACEGPITDGLFTNVISADTRLYMIWMVTNDEIKYAIFNIGEYRALGPDGFTFSFFKKSWEVVGNDIYNAVKDFFVISKLLKEINHTFFALIPKVLTPLKVNDYRPISCCNVLYKCISKILTNWIIEGIKEVVSENQSAFIPGRRISDNILLTREIMHNYHRNHGPLRLRLIFKKHMIRLTGSSWVIFSSDLVFIQLWLNGLWLVLRQLHDLFIFARGELDSARLIMESLDEFQKSSSLVPSIPKSMVYVCNVPNQVKLSILNIMWFAEGELPVKYLGVPLISTRLLNRDCKILVERVTNRIGDWKNKYLSFTARLQLCSCICSRFLWVAPNLGLIPMPILEESRLDTPQWKDANGRNINYVKDSELATLFGKLKYEDNLIDSIYETEKNKYLVSATPLSTTFFSTSIVQDFQYSPDDEEDTRSSHEYLNDLEEEYQVGALLAKSKRLFKKGTQRFSSAKVTDQTECHKCELSPTKVSKAKYNKVKAKLALLSLSASASKASMVKNKDLIVEAYEWDEEEVSSDDNEMVEIKVLMELTEDNDVVSKEGARNDEWVKISMKKILKEKNNLRTELKELTAITETWLKSSNKVNQCISEQIPSQKKRILGVDQLTKDPSRSGQKDVVFVKSSANDTKVSIPGVERPWFFEAECFIFPNYDTSRILPAESQRNTTDPLVTVTDSSAIYYDSADESSVYNTPLPTPKKLDGVILNEPFSAPARSNKSSSALKVNSAPAGKLKSVKINDDPPLAIDGGGLAKEVKNIKGKILGRDGKPLKSILKRPKIVADSHGSVSSTHKEDGPLTSIDGENITPVSVDGKRICKDGKPLMAVRRGVFLDPIHAINVTSNDNATVSNFRACNKEGPNSVVDGNIPIVRSFIEVVSPDSADKQDGREVPSQSDCANDNVPVFNKRVNFRTLINEEFVANNDTMLPKAAKESVMSRYANTLVGYLVGKSLAFQIVTNYVTKTWAKFGLSKLMKTDNEVNKVPVWVKLYTVLVVAYSEDWLSLIATQVGKPIMLDTFTSFMCAESWGRISFARALIEIHANSELKKEVRMAILIDDDDWTGINRRNKGEKVANQMLENLIAGIHFHKPKSSFYRPINKHANDKQSKKKSAANDKASTSGEKSTPVSNAFDALNSEEGVELGDSNPDKDVGKSHMDGVAQNPKFVNEEVVKEKEQDSLWSKFKAANEDSKSNPRTSMSDSDEESEVEEYPLYNSTGISLTGGGFSFDEEDLDCYDSYEAHVYDLTTHKQALWDQYDIRLNSHVHTTTDHNDIEWFRRGEALQAKKAKALKSTKAESSNANKSKTLTKRKPIWYLDSRCSRHMTGVKCYLYKYVEQLGPKVVFGDDSTCITEGYGSIKYNCIVFIKVEFVNGLKYNLISISQLCDAKYIVQFDEKRGTIFNSDKEVIMITPRVRDVYVLDMTSFAQESCFFSKASNNLNWLWYKILAHLNFKTINKLAKQNLVIGLPSLVYSKDKPCSSCEKGKHHRATFKTKQTSSIKKCLHLLHMDLFGLVTPRSINHEKYTLVIVDEYSRYTWVYFLKKKSQAPETVMSFIKRVEYQNDIKVKQLRTDNGTEFRNSILVNFCDEKGSILSKQYWIEAIATTCYAQNISTIMKRRLKTPYEIFHKRIPNINILHVFGCLVYIHNHKDHLGKFDEKVNDGYLLGYSLVSKAFRVFNIRRQQTKETYHVTFDKSLDAIKFLKPSVDDINIAETERYLPDEYLHPYEPS
ncbi:retrovirus-related pol polyprotein from transposon TNT 1-94 [Tanacetum coccineum]